MYAIHRIVVAIKDLKAASHPAIGKAIAIAAALDAQVQLFHAITVPMDSDLNVANGLPLSQVALRHEEIHLQLLEDIAKPLRRRGHSVATAVEWDFPPHEAIIRSAAHFDANLIVVADHATVHLMPWLLRYTDWELIRTSPVPVLLVKNPHPYRRPVILAALDPTHAFAKPAALDDEILRFSATLAGALHGAVHAVHGYVPVPANLPPELLSNSIELGRTLATVKKAAIDAVRKVTEPLGVSKARLHVVGRHPSDAVLEVATQTNSQIVALGSLSRSGLHRLVIGNTAEALLDRLHCDILVVKPPGFRPNIARKPRGARPGALPFAAGLV